MTTVVMGGERVGVTPPAEQPPVVVAGQQDGTGALRSLNTSATGVVRIESVAGAPAQVDVTDRAARQVGVVSLTGAVPAGANAIGKLAANSGVDIGDVDVTSLVAGAPSNASVVAYAASLVVKASAGTLFGLTGYNSLAAAQFIQVHDAAALPADGAVPKVIFRVEGLTNYSLDFGLKGRSFGTGIVVCNSSTGPTKTIGAADCWFDVQYV